MGIASPHPLQARQRAFLHTSATRALTYLPSEQLPMDGAQFEAMGNICCLPVALPRCVPASRTRNPTAGHQRCDICHDKRVAGSRGLRRRSARRDTRPRGTTSARHVRGWVTRELQPHGNGPLWDTTLLQAQPLPLIARYRQALDPRGSGRRVLGSNASRPRRCGHCQNVPSRPCCWVCRSAWVAQASCQCLVRRRRRRGGGGRTPSLSSHISS